jgi:hypothetical protein
MGQRKFERVPVQAGCRCTGEFNKQSHTIASSCDQRGNCVVGDTGAGADPFRQRRAY